MADDLESYIAQKEAGNIAAAAPATQPGGFDLENYINQKTYGTTGQQVLAGLEGVGQGVIGPIAPAFEVSTGLTTGKDIRGRAQANPVTHAVGEGAGFLGSLAIPGVAEVGLAGQVANVGEHAAALLPEVASKILVGGVKASAEMAALQTSNELTKMVVGDPNQTLGSAAINVGLSGLIGGAGGVAIGGVSNLWNKAKNISGVEKLLNDFQGETAAIQQAKGAAPSDFEAIPASSSSKSLGVKLARWVDENGADALAKAAGKSAAGVVGGGLGALVGHPFIGALAGEKILAPIISSLAKPLAENAIDSIAAKTSVDYLASAFKGQQILDNSVSNFFSKGSQVLAKDLIPDQADRNKLEKSLENAAIPSNAINIGGAIGHYLPQHATGVAESAAQAINYFQRLKPTQPITNPLDKVPPIDKTAQNNYNRQLDIAQQPLMVLQHVKNGGILPQDISTIRTLYPGLHDSMIRKLTNGIIQNKEAAQGLSYAQRQSLSILIGGTPLDSTMTAQAAQAIIGSASPKSQIQAQQTKSGQSGKASGSTLSQLNKVNSLGQTSLQAHQARNLSVR